MGVAGRSDNFPIHVTCGLWAVVIDTESDELGDDSNEDDDDDGIGDLLRDIGSFFNDCPIEKNLKVSTEEDSDDEESLRMTPADIEECHIKSLDRDDVEPDVVDDTLLNTMRGLYDEVEELAIKDSKNEDDTLAEYCTEHDDEQNDDDNDLF
uniref:Uncharacterized protein LOC109506519 n=1 Tax=Elaeis guineensis var. tenera TaxID=51953 RepID=A0A6J0PQH3_ELAGV|nr:uncharacterized protein LOC109506519 [Elaeis guineensis]